MPYSPTAQLTYRGPHALTGKSAAIHVGGMTST